MSTLKRELRTRLPASRQRGGFTLIEMMVAVSLLVLVILAVGRIFSDASKAVGISQASVEAFSNVRAFADQLERDVHSIDRSGFLVIRKTVPDPNGRCFDQISFLAVGQFPHRTGTTSTTNPFSDPIIANAAFIHLGHGIVEDAATALTAGQTGLVLANAAPTGNLDRDFVLLRNAILLMTGPPAGGNSITVSTTPPIAVAAFNSLFLTLPAPGTPAITVGGVDVGAPVAQITSSRVDVANTTSNAVMQSIVANAGPRIITNRYEADNYCYRFKTLTNPYAAADVVVGGSPSLVNGYYRMHPIFLQGCASFRVEWSDGVRLRGQVPTTDLQYIPNDTSLAWFGAASSPRYLLGDPTEPTPGNGDSYTAIFTFDNRAKWPKALKFTYRVTDPNDRLSGGRDFTQVIRLPE